jgi:hypothetical protein
MRNKQKIINMLFLATILFIIIYIASSISGKKNNSVVMLYYDKPINGLNIRVFWKPNTIRNSYIIGPAIIKFTNIKYGTSSTVVNNNFGILQERLNGSLHTEKRQNDSGEYNISGIDNKPICLTHQSFVPKHTQFSLGEAPDEPFFFCDLDFDGRDEILVREMFIGQRFYSTFKAYKFSDNQDIFVLEDDFLQITYDEPYIYLDETSAIDPLEKTLTIYVSGGAKDSEWKIYKYDGNNYILDKIIK